LDLFWILETWILDLGTFSSITLRRMIRALLLIIDPTNTWERIENSQHGIARVFFVSILPLLLVTSAIESYGLMTWGRERGLEHKVKPISTDLLVRYEGASLLLSLVLLFVGAWLLKMIAEGFHRRHAYRDAFATAAYSLSPLFLCRALNAFPGINLWIPWGIGIFLALAVLYRGIPRVLKPDPPSALGLYMLASLMFLVATGLANFLQILVLDEKILA